MRYPGVFSHMKTVYGVAGTTCANPRILFLDRHSRRVANIEQLVDGVKKLGLNNTSVELVKFEGWSFQQQMEMVRNLVSAHFHRYGGKDLPLLGKV